MSKSPSHYNRIITYKSESKIRFTSTTTTKGPLLSHMLRTLSGAGSYSSTSAGLEALFLVAKTNSSINAYDKYRGKITAVVDIEEVGKMSITSIQV